MSAHKFVVVVVVFAGMLATADNIPASNIASSVIAKSTVRESSVAASSIAVTAIDDSMIASSQVSDVYRSWIDAAATPCSFPDRSGQFVPHENPVMLRIDNPADVDRLIAAAIVEKGAGRGVYFCYSPRTQPENFQFQDVIDAIEKLAPFCDAFAPAFHRTGAHYNYINRNVAARLCLAACAGNKNIMLLGELYYGELYAGEVADGFSCFTFPGCAGLLGVNLPRGSRTEIYTTLSAAGATDIPLVEVIPRELPPHKRYHNHLIIDIDEFE